jgi:hypothetical protein
MHDNTITTAVEALAKAVASIIAGDGDARELAASFTDFQRHLERSGVRKAAQSADALAISVASIINDSGDAESKRSALAESFGQAERHLERELGLAVPLGKGRVERDTRARRDKYAGLFGEITKADRGGPHNLTGALLDHLHDRLSEARRRHGFEKTATKDDPTMTSTSTHAEFVRDVAKRYGVTALCKSMAQDGKAYGLSEHELVELITEEAQAAFPDLTSARAFGKIYTEGERGRTLQKAVGIAKAAAFQVFYGPSMTPAQIGGEDVNPDNVNEALRKLAEIGAKKWPHERPDVQFSRAFESEPALARAAHVRPTAPAGGAYPMPR